MSDYLEDLVEHLQKQIKEQRNADGDYREHLFEFTMQLLDVSGEPIGERVFELLGALTPPEAQVIGVEVADTISIACGWKTKANGEWSRMLEQARDRAAAADEQTVDGADDDPPDVVEADEPPTSDSPPDPERDVKPTFRVAMFEVAKTDFGGLHDEQLGNELFARSFTVSFDQARRICDCIDDGISGGLKVDAKRTLAKAVPV